jgi:hypothetical protein
LFPPKSPHPAERLLSTNSPVKNIKRKIFLVIMDLLFVTTIFPIPPEHK